MKVLSSMTSSFELENSLSSTLSVQSHAAGLGTSLIAAGITSHLLPKRRASLDHRSTHYTFPLPDAQHLVSEAKKYLYILYLFTKDDIKTIFLPELLFAFSVAVSGLALGIPQPLKPLQALARLLPAAFWGWINLLCFATGNQSRPEAVKEDALNKPGRPIPAGLITLSATLKLKKASQVACLLTALYLGGTPQSLLLQVFYHVYNELGGSDRSWALRNGLNATAIPVFGMGAACVVLGDSWAFGPKAYIWVGIIAAIIFTTVHCQDMGDQDGDRERGRQTVPLVFGDTAARWSLAFGVTIWSIFLPRYWSSPECAVVVMLALGLLIAWRFLELTDAKSDKLSFKLWCLWLVGVYLLPMM